ncbi:hypothetical protein ACFL7D_03040 [candidate division KSB1 bacterium]
MRKSLILIILSLVIISGFTFSSPSEPSLAYFRIGFVPIEDKIQLKWKSVLEVTLKEYILERSTDNLTFNKISAVKPKGDNSEYVFRDNNIFKTSSRTFYYKLRLVKEDGTYILTDTQHLSPRVSSAKLTWGSIKKIFH